jgi:hypothetical protein
MMLFMSAPTAELSSMTTALEELSQRVAAIADEYQRAKREDLASELYEVERTLSIATRRMNRVARASGA